MRLKKIFLICLLIIGTLPPTPAFASDPNCPDLRIIFARGSGGGQDHDDSFTAFKSALKDKLKTTSLSFQFTNLKYPAVPVGPQHPLTSLGALINGDHSITFGNSITAGSEELLRQIHSSCPKTRFVLGGYSQGAIVLSKSFSRLPAEKIIYSATFGDPKIYLPEGKGLFPDACYNRNLSDYRIYVPDCRAHHGLLGGYVPYRPAHLKDKIGTWCNKHDLFCSSHLSTKDHLAYVSDQIYEDASRLIFDKIAQSFKLENSTTSPHDTAFLIDSTGSMSHLIHQYKQEALRLAQKTLDTGGRIALFEYRDLADPFPPIQHCNFNTCDLATFRQKLTQISPFGGGDTPESFLSSALTALRSLDWRYGSTKSLVALTDANFHSPDLDGTTINQVINISHLIDPVNFYIITTPEFAPAYQTLADQTDGAVVTEPENFHLITDQIIARFDSLPRTEPIIDSTAPSLTLNLTHVTAPFPTTLKLDLDTDADQTLIVLNDALLGSTTETSFTITNLNRQNPLSLRLIPVKNGFKGSATSLNLPPLPQNIPKAPNTGAK